MASAEFWFGWFFLILGLVALWGYLAGNKMIFSKRDRYVKIWGETLGKIMHFISYVIIPIAVGIYFLLFR